MRKIASVCLAALAVLLLSCAAFAAETSLVIRPNLVGIGASYNGTDIALEGQVPEGTYAVIRLLGEPKDRHFKQKGKALGLLWMNLNTIEIKDAPDVFLMGTDGTQNIDWEHSDLGFKSIKGETDDLIFDDFLKLMEHDGFYEIENGVIRYGDVKDGMRPFNATLHIPSAMHQGIYQVEVLAVNDGAVVGKATEALHTELTGIPAMLAKVAFDHSLLYGIAAVIIAVLAGLFMSMLFKERGGVH